MSSLTFHHLEMVFDTDHIKNGFFYVYSNHYFVKMCLGTGQIEKVFHQYGILYASLNHNYVKITLGTYHMEIVSHRYGFFYAPLSFNLLKIM